MRAFRGGRWGFTLVELLIVLVITAILASALGYAFTAEMTMQRVEESRRADLDRGDATERRIARLLQGAKLTAPTAAAGQTTYFAGLAENGADDLGCGRLTFTTTAPALPLATLDGTDDFETQQGARGPVGGLAEVSLSVTPVGDAGGRLGLFERLQRPAGRGPDAGRVRVPPGRANRAHRVPVLGRVAVGHDLGRRPAPTAPGRPGQLHAARGAGQRRPRLRRADSRKRRGRAGTAGRGCGRAAAAGGGGESVGVGVCLQPLPPV